jgi:hypothetical protein
MRQPELDVAEFRRVPVESRLGAIRPAFWYRREH